MYCIPRQRTLVDILATVSDVRVALVSALALAHVAAAVVAGDVAA